MREILLLTVLCVIFCDVYSSDEITDLPGLTFKPNFKQYSGYLNGIPGNYLHYWLVESQSTPATDPLVLWLNGGPGCSSLGGFFTELGPFHPNPGGKTLFENVYSWNKKANVLFLEAPRNVGFSYQDKSINSDSLYNDDKTAFDNFLAVKHFMDKYPAYKTRPFYVTGESYGGVYVPTLTQELIKQIQIKNLTANLIGMAVGNGELSEILQVNSAVDYLYFHGMYGKDEWDALKACCPKDQPLSYCDFTQWIHLNQFGDSHPINNSDCARRVNQMGFYRVWMGGNDVYNLYQDCYQVKRVKTGSKLFQRYSNPTPQQWADFESYIDQGSLINWASTDHLGGFPCYMGNANAVYLNQTAVRTALHIPSHVQPWADCSDDINTKYYYQQHNDTTSVFEAIMQSGYKLRMLIYNGDADTACNFLGDEWFVENLKTTHNMTVKSARKAWSFTQQPPYQPVIAGYRKQFSYKNDQITIDLVTVKGAGHFVPTDRPGPALQMITSFLNKVDYNMSTGYSITRRPLINGPTAIPLTTTSSTAFFPLSLTLILISLLFSLQFRF